MFTKKLKFPFWAFATLLVVSSLCLLSCGPITCPAFADEKFDLWFPYSVNEQFVFAGTSLNSDTLKIGYINRSKEYETSGGWGHKGCREPEASISGNGKLNLNIYVGGGSSYIMFGFGNISIQGSSIKDSGIVVIKSNFLKSSTFQSSLVLNGKAFAQVQSFEMDTTIQKPTLYKLWLSKSKGIIAYQKRLGNELFVLQ